MQREFATCSLRLRVPSLCEPLSHRTSLALGDLTFHSLSQRHAAPVRRKVLNHLPIPRVVIEIVEPSGKGMTVIFGEPGNGVFDGVDSHTQTIARENERYKQRRLSPPEEELSYLSDQDCLLLFLEQEAAVSCVVQLHHPPLLHFLLESLNLLSTVCLPVIVPPR